MIGRLGKVGVVDVVEMILGRNASVTVIVILHAWILCRILCQPHLMENAIKLVRYSTKRRIIVSAHMALQGSQMAHANAHQIKFSYSKTMETLMGAAAVHHWSSEPH